MYFIILDNLFYFLMLHALLLSENSKIASLGPESRIEAETYSRGRRLCRIPIHIPYGWPKIRRRHVRNTKINRIFCTSAIFFFFFWYINYFVCVFLCDVWIILKSFWKIWLYSGHRSNKFRFNKRFNYWFSGRIN